MQKKSALTALCLALLLGGAGCGTTTNVVDGGLYKSVDGGNKWELKSDLLTTKGVAANFVTQDVNVMTVDPNDSRAMWIGTMNAGILYSFNGGEGWQQVLDSRGSDLQIATSRVTGLAVDPTNGCVVYATIVNPAAKSYLVRTINCGRSWGLLFTNELPNEQLGSVVVNPNQSTQLFMANSAGDLWRSDNAGTSWTQLKRFSQSVRVVTVHPKNKNLIYVGLRKGGLWKSMDAGQTWEQLDLKKYRGAEEVYQVVVDAATDTVLIGTNYGILHSGDSGLNWDAFQLLTSPNETQIISLAVNPQNPKRVYYGTPKGFYRSEDGGQTWSTKKIPTSRVVKSLYIDTTGGTENVWLGAWQTTK